MSFCRLSIAFVLVFLFCQVSIAAQRRTPIVDAVSKAHAAVVNVRTEKITQRSNSPFFGFGDSIFDQFFQNMLPQRTYKTQSLGSGVIIDSEGHILTNAHVVEKASKIYIALSDRQLELEAELIGQDRRIDLAILKIVEPGEYPFLPPGRSDDLMLGETVIAIGNPLGLGHSITTGIVSSQKRRIQIDQQLSSIFIQSDALINPGNSGGPLININGELIGINTAIARQAQGIGFSVPIDTAKRVLDDLIDYGLVRRGFLGVFVGTVSSSFVRSYGEGGVLIDEVEKKSPADRAGLLEADVILAIDDIPISSPDHYHSLLQTYTPEDSLKLTLLRGLKQVEQVVNLELLPEGYGLDYSRRIFGFELHQGKNGLLVEKVMDGSPADQVGMRRGDLVAKVESAKVETIAEYESVIETYLGQQPLKFTVVRENTGYLIELP